MEMEKAKGDSPPEEKRHTRRILAVCRVLDEGGHFLGFTLDLTRQGVRLIVDKTFNPEGNFEVILSPPQEDEEIAPDISITVKPLWRCPANDEFDEIGGTIVTVDCPDSLTELMEYCDCRAEDRYYSQA
ncbi:MAG: PilZ domain-containing protein [Geminocystis sp.]|nr:PilZ domain-containing protein [Geminocystis sp.]